MDHMTTSMRKEEDQSRVTERILNLTQDITFLLTREDYKVVKKTSGEPLTPNRCLHGPSPVTEPPPHCLTREENIAKKILEVTEEIVELLTGEVPIRCQDVSVYFSMEEWEYLGGHRDLYKDVMMEDQQLPSCGKMGNNNFLSNKIILNHTLEIIYLLIGEDCAVVKTTSIEDCVERRGHHLSTRERSITVCPPPFLTLQRNNKQKVLEVTQKIIELLTGEVPIRCRDVSVYFSMEEWEYLGGHRDLYKDFVMENEPPLTSPDGSSKRNPPERCPRPLYSRDSTQEDLTVPHHDQHEEQMYIIVQVKEEEEETSVMEYEQTTEEVGKMVTIKEEEPSLDISTDGSSKRNPPERCPRPLYSQDSTQEGLTVPHHDQGEELKDIKIEIKEEGEETLVSGAQQSMEEGEMTVKSKQEKSLYIDTSGLYAQNSRVSNGAPMISPDCNEDDSDIAQYSPGVNSDRLASSMDPSNPEESSDNFHTMSFQSTDSSTDPPNPEQSSLTHEGVHTGENSLSCSVCGKSFTDKKALLKHQASHANERRFSCSVCGKSFTWKRVLIEHQKIHTGERPFPCSECGKCFTQKGDLVRHQRIHTGERPYSCSECGKSFTQKIVLLTHQRVHTGEHPFSCSECGKCFSRKENLVGHQKRHTGKLPFSCADCGKAFSQKGNLYKHQRIHTGERPFSCSECGKSFVHKAHLHQKSHTGEGLFSCSECGKCYIQKSALIVHQRIHTGEYPFSCSDCGKCFTEKEKLIIHQRNHTGKRPYSCSDCGKSFIQKGHLLTHQRSHTGERPFSCSECGKSFGRKEVLIEHQRIHTGERPFACLECEKSFTRKGSLIAHQKIHTGEGLFSCSECEKSFRFKGNLVRHQRTHSS